MLTLGIIGSTGRFGQAVMAAAAHAGVPVVLTSDRSGAFSSAVPTVLVCTATQPGVEVAAVLAGNLGRPLVVASSGLLATDRLQLVSLAEKVPVLVAANLTRGHQIQRLAVAAAAGALAPGDASAVTVVDRHTPSKLERPSATALALAAAWIKAASGGVQVAVTSIRAGAPVADHSVVLTLADDEAIIIEHRVPSLTAAARGALRAVAWLAAQDAGMYDSVPADLPADLPTAVPAGLPADLPTAVPAGILSDLPAECRPGLPGGITSRASSSGRSMTPSDASDPGAHDAVAYA